MEEACELEINILHFPHAEFLHERDADSQPEKSHTPEANEDALQSEEPEPPVEDANEEIRGEQLGGTIVDFHDALFLSEL